MIVNAPHMKATTTNSKALRKSALLILRVWPTPNTPEANRAAFSATRDDAPTVATATAAAHPSHNRLAHLLVLFLPRPWLMPVTATPLSYRRGKCCPAMSADKMPVPVADQPTFQTCIRASGLIEGFWRSWLNKSLRLTVSLQDRQHSARHVIDLPGNAADLARSPPSEGVVVTPPPRDTA